MKTSYYTKVITDNGDGSKSELYFENGNDALLFSNIYDRFCGEENAEVENHCSLPVPYKSLKEALLSHFSESDVIELLLKE